MAASLLPGQADVVSSMFAAAGEGDGPSQSRQRSVLPSPQAVAFSPHQARASHASAPTPIQIHSARDTPVGSPMGQLDEPLDSFSPSPQETRRGAGEVRPSTTPTANPQAAPMPASTAGRSQMTSSPAQTNQQANPAAPAPAGAVKPPPAAPSFSTAITIKEQSYIPLALAKRKIETIEGDMRAMRERHLAALAEVNKHYSSVEEESRGAFLAFIKRLRKEARAKEKELTKKAQTELAALKESSSNQISSLEKRLTTVEGELAAALRSHADEISKLSADSTAVLELERVTNRNEKEDLRLKIEGLTAEVEEARKATSEALSAAALQAAATEGLSKEKMSEIEVLLNGEKARVERFKQLIDTRDEVIHGLEKDRKRLVQTLTMMGQENRQLRLDAKGESSNASMLVQHLRVELEASKRAQAQAESSCVALQSELRSLQAALKSAQESLALSSAALSEGIRESAGGAGGAGGAASTQQAETALQLARTAAALAQSTAETASLRSQLENIKKQQQQGGTALVVPSSPSSVSAPVAFGTPPAQAQTAETDAPSSASAAVAAAQQQMLLSRNASLSAEVRTLNEALQAKDREINLLKAQLQEAAVQHKLDAVQAADVDKDDKDDEKLAALRAELEKMKAASASASAAMMAAAVAPTPAVAAASHGDNKDAEEVAALRALAASREVEIASLRRQLEEQKEETSRARAAATAGEGKEGEDGGGGENAEGEGAAEEDEEDEGGESKEASDDEGEAAAKKLQAGTTSAAASTPSAAAATKSPLSPATGAKGAAAAAATTAAAGAAAAGGGGGGASAAKVRELEKTVKELRAKVRGLEAAAVAAKGKAGAGGAAGGGAAGGIDSKALEEALAKRQTVLEKKFKKEKEDMEKDHQKELDAFQRRLTKATAELEQANAALQQVTSERDGLKRKVGGLGELEKELDALRLVAEEVKGLKAEVASLTAKTAELDKLYRDEMLLRKKYHNIIEDMKGKIRVYARCRPISTSERERGNVTVVSFPDDVTVDLDCGPRGRKQFIYDKCFGPASRQEEVFQETENLIQSAFDGYNVAIFAYGQTGSGKTFTMVGSRDMPGLTPRAISRLYSLIEENKGTYEVTVQAYMVELYLDNLIDLFYKLDNPRDKNLDLAPKLEIKKDDKGLVTIKGVSLRDCPSEQSVMDFFDAGNAVRHTSATAMNATSSRSHLVFALLIKSFNKQTKKTATGKLSMIDLAGSERVAKTGATADRLKEATAINRSLSALGNVISALSTNAAFIPYRDNKLTQLMSDSLGGNAKTLCFVNFSPVDYNAEETQSSLVYAARIKLITNSAEKQQETAEIQRLKKIIATLKAGGSVAEGEDLSGPAGGSGDGDSGGGAGGSEEDEMKQALYFEQQALLAAAAEGGGSDGASAGAGES